MKFLDFENHTEPSLIKNKFDAYQKYLADNRTSIPPSAYEFAAADWHYNPQDPRCPHDSWVESLQISEEHLPQIDRQDGIKIQLMLLGAYHDGQIRIIYEGVKSYSFNLLPDSFEIKHHGDWIIDEIRLSENGWLIHEIEFWLKGRWQIECKDIKYEWLSFEK